MKRKPFVFAIFATIATILLFFGYTKIAENLSRSEPEITVWYGDRQTFHHLGQPQKQINILGKVQDRDEVVALNYSLNGGIETYLSMGPDTRRLVNPGDFNIELFVEQLAKGSNSILIRAMDEEGNIAEKKVYVENKIADAWEMPYRIEWDAVGNLTDVVQVVDGLWEISETGVHTVEAGYDRLLAIGDMSWKDYQILVPVTVHRLNPDGWEHPSGGPAVGILTYWNGHTDYPRAGWQPKSGWLPLGAIGWYRWVNDQGAEQLQFLGSNNETLAKDISGKKLEFNKTYWFKMVVQSSNLPQPVYKLKVWPVEQAEPENWDLTAEGLADDPESGSVLLLAHEADATFGNVEITPVLSE